MSSQQVAGLREAFTAAQAIGDDRGYQHWAGIHGLPLPMYCTHGSPLFLAWHRAYLYFFELALRDQVPDLVLPWWDWTVDQSVPNAYNDERVNGSTNPLFSSPIQPSGREPGGSDHTVRAPGQDGAPPLPTAAQVQALLALGDFIDFQTQLEDIHNGVHVWVGATMSDIATAAYDPLFWAHHTMIDRLWRVWQLNNPHGGPPTSLSGDRTATISDDRRPRRSTPQASAMTTRPQLPPRRAPADGRSLCLRTDRTCPGGENRRLPTGRSHL